MGKNNLNNRDEHKTIERIKNKRNSPNESIIFYITIHFSICTNRIDNITI